MAHFFEQKIATKSCWFLFCFLFFFTGCNLAPNYEPPSVDVPQQWKASPTDSNSDSNSNCETETFPCVEYWWEVFNDETLNYLELDAVANNLNLNIAVERVFEAFALAGIKKADLFPQFNLNPSYSNSGLLIEFFTPPTPLPFPIIKFFRIHQMEYTLPLYMNYEIDLWGKLRNQYRAELRNAEAQAEALRTTLLSITTDLAMSYFLLRFLDAQIDLYQATVEEYRKFYDLAKSRFDKGLVNYLDVTTASLQLSNVETELFDLTRQRNLEENKIAVLLGVAPARFSIEHSPLNTSPPVIPSGIPSTVLLQRPDIAEAERELASKNALIGVAYASFYPSLELTGALGFLSPDFSQFLKWISRYWSIGANIGQTVFDGGRNCSSLELAWARFREADSAYQQKVLIAFQEVEDALNNLYLQAKQAEGFSRSVEFAKTAASLSLNRYRQGLANYLEVVQSQKSALEAEVNLTTIQSMRFLSTVQLIKALGGCWEY